MSTDYHKQFMDDWTHEATEATGITVAEAKRIIKAKWGKLPRMGYESLVKEWTEPAPYPFGTITRRVWLTNTCSYYHLKIL